MSTAKLVPLGTRRVYRLQRPRRRPGLLRQLRRLWAHLYENLEQVPEKQRLLLAPLREQVLLSKLTLPT